MDIEVIWVRRERKYFLKWGWTGLLPNSPSGKSVGLSAVARRKEGVTRLLIVGERRITLQQAHASSPQLLKTLYDGFDTLFLVFEQFLERKFIELVSIKHLSTTY
jgi:hypothetical protein